MAISDDNCEIVALLRDRLAIGRERYGHGVIVDDDTRQYGTADNNWETMMMEEALDGMIYAAAQLIRLKRHRAEEVPTPSNTPQFTEPTRDNIVSVVQVGSYVVKEENNMYTCTCPDFQYRIGQPVEKDQGCKHIKNL